MCVTCVHHFAFVYVDTYCMCRLGSKFKCADVLYVCWGKGERGQWSSAGEVHGELQYNVSSCLRLHFSMTGPFSSVKRVTLIHHIPNHHKKGKSIYSSFNETIYMTWAAFTVMVHLGFHWHFECIMPHEDQPGLPNTICCCDDYIFCTSLWLCRHVSCVWFSDHLWFWLKYRKSMKFP